MSLVLLTLLIILASAIYWLLRRHYSYWARHNVPHEPPVYLLGNMRGIGTRYHWKDINARMYRRFKGQTPIAGMYTFLSKAVFVIDLDLIKQIMVKDFNVFADRGLFHNVRDDPLTGNLLFLDGEQWRVLRHKLSPVFTTGKIRYMFPTIVAVGEHLVRACASMVEQQNGTLELKDLCARYTTDVIGTCAFGIECNSLQDPQAEFRCMGREIVDKPRHSLLVQAFMFTNPHMARKLRMKNFPDNVTEFFMKVVRETLELREKHNIKRNDFMDMMVEMKAKRDQLDKAGIKEDDLSNGLTFEQVAAQAMVFYLAGFETSSTVMSFCMYELALNSDVQEKLRTEILETLKAHNNALTYEAIKEMHYLDKVISETLRKYPVLPHLVRQTVAEFRIPNTDLTLERGMHAMIPIAAIHNDPAIYPAPEQFDPERFSAEAVSKRHPFAYLPFGEGPRNCIGMRFGQLQSKIGVITLLRHFRFSPTAETQIPIKYANKNFLIAAESGIHLKVEKL